MKSISHQMLIVSLCERHIKSLTWSPNSSWDQYEAAYERLLKEKAVLMDMQRRISGTNK